MAFREVSVVQVREALRRWLYGDGERAIARRAGIDRKTARRYIAAAIEFGVSRSGDESQLTDEVVGRVCERVRPRRPDGHGDQLASAARPRGADQGRPHRGEVGILLARRGVEVPHRTLARFAVERCGAGRGCSTVRVDDPPPGRELQVDFGRLGLVANGERRRLCWALIFTARSPRSIRPRQQALVGAALDNFNYGPGSSLAGRTWSPTWSHARGNGVVPSSWQATRAGREQTGAGNLSTRPRGGRARPRLARKRRAGSPDRGSTEQCDPEATATA